MSWNKNTVVVSDIDSRVDMLKENGIPYTLTILGKVSGMGLNDAASQGILDSSSYLIRKLEYKDKLIVEQMQRQQDCDFDDHLVSIKFLKSEAPKEWKLEMYIPDPDYDNDMSSSPNNSVKL